MTARAPAISFFSPTVPFPASLFPTLTTQSALFFKKKMERLHLAALEDFLSEHPDIKCTLPSSPDYLADRKVFLLSRRANPLAIAHPETAEQVSELVKFLRSNGIKFTFRSGGHNLLGLSIEDGALTIDMRAFSSVHVAANRLTATVGAGILQSELCNTLWEKGLATSTGSIPSVGYLGWAMYGGYGPFSSNWGLGVDQIVGATLVDASGSIVRADDVLLKAIRGTGGAFGVIIDVSIKVYHLKSVSQFHFPLFQYATCQSVGI